MEFPLLAMMQEQGLTSTSAPDSAEEPGIGFAEIFSGIRKELLAGLFTDPAQAQEAPAEADSPNNAVTESMVAGEHLPEATGPALTAVGEPQEVLPSADPVTMSATDTPGSPGPAPQDLSTDSEAVVSEANAPVTKVAMASTPESLPASATVTEDGAVTGSAPPPQSPQSGQPLDAARPAGTAGAPGDAVQETPPPSLTPEASAKVIDGAPVAPKAADGAAPTLRSDSTGVAAVTMVEESNPLAANGDSEKPVPNDRPRPAVPSAATVPDPEADAAEDSVALLERLAEKAPKNAMAIRPRRATAGTVLQDAPSSDSSEPLPNTVSSSGGASEAIRGAVLSDTAARPSSAPAQASGESGSTEASLPRTPLDQASAQAIRSIRYLLGNGERRVTVRLVPESLGEIHVEIRSAGSEVSVRLIAANPAVRETLDAQTQGLREALNREGISVDKIDVSAGMTADSGPSHHAGREAAQANPGRHAMAFLSGSGYTETEEDTLAAPAPVSVHEGALDLYV